MMMLMMAGFATPSMGQITVSVKDKPLTEVMPLVEKQGGFRFFYSNTLPDLDSKVTLSVENAGIPQTLDKMFAGLRIAYEIRNEKLVVLTAREDSRQQGKGNGDNTVSGTVLDKSGQPVIGLTIRENGTTNGTVTDENGRWSLKVSKTDSELIFESLGYKTLRIKAAGRQTVNVTVEEDTTLLDEIVVVGYGVQKKVNISGSVSSVKMDDILQDRPVSNVAAALQGAIPGLYVTTGSSGNLPGQTGKRLQIRGTSSFSGSSNSVSGISPLVLIDNVPGDIDALNPDDIESVTVLKDASSSAIYGARAAAGVILITTKSPKKAERISISYNGSIGLTNAVNTPDMVDIATYIGVYRDAFNTNTYGAAQDQNFDKWLEYLNLYKTNKSALSSQGTLYDNGIFVPDSDGLRYYLTEEDLYKRMMETGIVENNNVSVSGATDRIRFRMSGNNFRENGPLAGRKDTYSRTSVNGMIQADITSWFTQELNFYFTQQHRKMLIDETGSLYGVRNLNFMPDGPDPVKKDGKEYFIRTPRNVIDYANAAKTTIDQPRIFSKSTIRPFKGMEVVFEYTYQKNLTNYNYDSGKVMFTDIQLNYTTAPTHDYSIARHYNDYRSAINAYATYRFDIARKHHFSVMGGFNQEYYNYEWYNTNAEDQAFLNIPSMSNAQGQVKTADSYLNYALRSAFGRINYNYDERYLIEFSGRYDGSSKFPKDTRFGFFPSFSVAWNATNEAFMSGTRRWLTELKPRFSYGSIGNQTSVGYYDYYSTMGLSTKSYVWLKGADESYVTSIGMPGIVSDSFTWETITTTNAGLDFGLFGGSLAGSFDWFRRDTKDILSQSVALPAVLGDSAPMQNVGKMRTTGWEFQLSYKGSIGREILYNVGFNVSDYKSKVMSLNFNEEKSLGYLYEGMMAGEIWGYRWDGFYTVDDFKDTATWQLKDGVTGITGSSPRPGDFKYKNLRDNEYSDEDTGMINSGKGTANNPGDMTVIGNSTPRFQYGFNFNISYKGFDLGIMIQGIGKRDYAAINPYTYTLSASDPGWFPVFAGTTDYWKPLSTDSGSPDYYKAADSGAKLPRIYGSTIKGLSNASSNRLVNDHMLQSAAYLRVKNLSLSYSFPKSLIGKAGLGGLKVYVSCENPFTVSSLPKGIDPETLGWSYPLYRTVSFGMNIKL